jgi:hypothetical protein
MKQLSITPTPSNQGEVEDTDSIDCPIGSTVNCSPGYVCVNVRTKADLRTLTAFLRSFGEVVTTQVNHRKVPDGEGRFKTVEIDSWLCVISRKAYNTLVERGYNKPNRYDFIISVYQIRTNNLPKENATYKIFAPFPKGYPKDDASRRWICEQMNGKLRLMRNIFSLSENQVSFVNPLSNSRAGKYHVYMNVNIDAPPKVIAIIKHLLDMTQWYALPFPGFDSRKMGEYKSRKDFNSLLSNADSYFCRVAWNTTKTYKKGPNSKKSYTKKKKAYTPKKTYTPRNVAGSPVISPKPKRKEVVDVQLPTPTFTEPVAPLTFAPSKTSTGGKAIMQLGTVIASPTPVKFGTHDPESVAPTFLPKPEETTRVVTPTKTPGASFSLTPTPK